MMENRWLDNWRMDGLFIATGLEGDWIILPPDDSKAVSRCPCCERPLDTKEAAKFVADRVFKTGVQ